MHGFDEFFGNLYHLNAEEEPENPDYPKDPAFKREVRPARRASTAGHNARRRRSKIEDTGPLTNKRMETIDEEFTDGGARLHGQRRTRPTSPSSSGGTRPACTSSRTSSRKSEGKTGLGIYPDGMVEHDGHVGQLLDKLDELGIADNTIVMYSTDNGAEKFTWPDGGTTPFRGEKNTNWEGGFRVPA